MAGVPEARSRLMASIRGKDTRPERVVRSYLHRQGLRFRLHKRGLPGSPDIVLPRFGVAIFVHGCFWHQHGGTCRHTGIPQSNTTYWRDKFEKIAERDSRKERQLRELGWRVLVVWECEIAPKTLAKLVEEVQRGRAETAASRLIVQAHRNIGSA